MTIPDNDENSNLFISEELKDIVDMSQFGIVDASSILMPTALKIEFSSPQVEPISGLLDKYDLKIVDDRCRYSFSVLIPDKDIVGFMKNMPQFSDVVMSYSDEKFFKINVSELSISHIRIKKVLTNIGTLIKIVYQ